MKADFTRSTFRPEKQYSSVRLQQGRVQLDADWNEQIDIQAYRDQTTMHDLVGKCGAPVSGGGFKIAATTLRDVFFVDEKHGWAVGDDATILTTIDGGDTWSRQTPPAGVKAHLHSVQFISDPFSFDPFRKQGWIVGDDATILRTTLMTTDQKTIWTRQTAPDGVRAHLRDVSFVSVKQGWIIGDDATILTTIDGGKTWSRQTPPAGVKAHLHSVQFISSKSGIQGWIVGDDATILMTTDEGTTWRRQTPPVGVKAHLHSVHFISGTQGWAVGDDATILATTDGGITWMPQTSPAGMKAYLHSVRFIPSKSRIQGWIVGDDATILTTIDDGKTWSRQTPPDGVKAHLRGARFGSFIESRDIHGWAVGDNATVLKTKDGGITWTRQTQIPNYSIAITAGHIYVDGILCENPETISYIAQTDLPESPLPAKPGIYLAYLDVWQRHLTWLDDAAMREVALGGPDTATRTKTVWQVKLYQVGDQYAEVDCTQFKNWEPPQARTTGKLAARATPMQETKNECDVPAGAGYRRLENQLYRVEVHDDGELGTATFKWSRDNGTVVALWLDQDPNDSSKLTVSDVGRDAVLCFAEGQWVELSDDTLKLSGQPGTLVQLDKVEGNILTIKDPSNSIKRENFPSNPKVRRWDSSPTLNKKTPATGDGWLALEDGVEIKFEPGFYKSGDYWLIPARTISRDVEWQQKEENGKLVPVPQSPHGITHHYGALALIESDQNSAPTVHSDCRQLFPAVTELITLFYVGGDGQEAIPGAQLPKPLQVGVANGQHPVPEARVKFQVNAGDGTLQRGESEVVSSENSNAMIVKTMASGIADCRWTLEPDTKQPSQHLEAILLDDEGNAIGLPVRFNANLSIASQVAYNPSKDCPDLKNVTTVQQAIDTLCKSRGDEYGIRIVQVTLNGKPLIYNRRVPVNEVNEGFILKVECDPAINPKLINKAMVSLTLEMPVEGNQIGLLPNLVEGLIGFHPLILVGKITSGDNPFIWESTVPSQLFKVLPGIIKKLDPPEMLARLTLKGNFAESGENRRGGDFERWFWLIPPTLGVPGIGLIPNWKSRLLVNLQNRDAMISISHLAIDRRKLIGFLPSGYQIDETQQFNPTEASRAIDQLHLRGTKVLLFVGKGLSQLGNAVSEMMTKNTGLQISPVSFADDALLGEIRKSIASETPVDMVLGDENLAQQLAQVAKDNFDAQKMIRL